MSSAVGVAPELRFIGAQQLTDEQRRYVKRKWLELARTIPRTLQPPHVSAWVLLKGDEPIGTFTAIPYELYGENYSEVGVCVWAPSRGVLDMGRVWLSHLLCENAHMVGRVFPSNRRVLKVIQLLGFRLCAYDRDLDGRLLEVHKLGRGQLMPPRPRQR